MKIATTTARMLVRLTGAIQIVLGLLFWTGNALNLIPIHMLSGTVLVLALWALAFLAARAGVDGRRVALAIAWGLIVLILGLTQSRLLPGAFHLLVQVVHLLIGLGAIGQAEWLARQTRAGRAPLPHPETQPALGGDAR
jgi:hypothetical protein